MGGVCVCVCVCGGGGGGGGLAGLSYTGAWWAYVAASDCSCLIL